MECVWWGMKWSSFSAQPFLLRDAMRERMWFIFKSFWSDERTCNKSGQTFLFERWNVESICYQSSTRERKKERERKWSLDIRVLTINIVFKLAFVRSFHSDIQLRVIVCLSVCLSFLSVWLFLLFFHIIQMPL